MLVISAKSGQLGNRLLLSAHFIAFACEKNFTVLNPAFEEYADFFKSTSQDFLCRYPSSRFSIEGNKLLRKYYYKINRYLAESGRFNTIEIKRNQPFNWSNLSITKELTLKIESFVHFYQWQGVFYYNEDWSKTFWEWTH